MQYRPWISLALTIHLFAIAVSMSGNMSPSMLQQRLRFLLSPYLIGLNWYMDYVPVELTHGVDTDGQWWIQLRDSSLSNDWKTITPGNASYTEANHRVRNLARLTGLMAMQQRTDEATLLLSGFITQEAAAGRLPIQRSNQPDPATSPSSNPTAESAAKTERRIEVRIIRQPIRTLEDVELANRIGAQLDPLRTESVFVAQAVQRDGNQWLIIPQSDPRRMVPPTSTEK